MKPATSCGRSALSSALLLLRSANDLHPDGLANASGQVGRASKASSRAKPLRPYIRP